MARNLNTTVQIGTEELLILPTSSWDCELEVRCVFQPEDRSSNYAGGWELDGLTILSATKYDSDGKEVAYYHLEDLTSDLQAELLDAAEKWADKHQNTIFEEACNQIEAARP